MKKLLLASILWSFIFVLFSPVAPVNAAVLQITDDSDDDTTPQISNGKVVWAKYDNVSESDVYLYDITTGVTTKLADNAVSPQIDNDKVIWTTTTDGDSEIFLYDIATESTLQITNNNVSDNTADLNDGKIVWMQGGDGEDTEIFLYDITSGITSQITDNSYYDNNPYISGDNILFDRLEDPNWEVFYYNIPTGVTTKITDSNDAYTEDFAMQIDNNTILWGRGGGSPRQIFFYDISTGNSTLVTNNFTGFSSAQIDDGKIVWQGWNPLPMDAPYEIFLYNIASTNTIQLTDNDFGDNGPQINDGKVVWVGNGPIYTYDLASNVTAKITNNDSDSNDFPQTSGGMVVWQNVSGEDNRRDLFLWDGIQPENAAPVINNLQDTEINIGEYSTVGSFIDADSTSWSATVDYGDGSGMQPLSLNGTNFELNHVYNTTGMFTVTVVVTDDGGLSDTERAEVTIVNSEPVTLYPIADSYLKQGSSNQNEGASTFMRLQSSGHNRGLIKFDESQIESAVGNSQNYTATLQLAITDLSNNWGANGRPVAVHRFTKNWDEGNGFVDSHTPIDRGTGNGVTWNCAVDSNISNQAKNCSGTTEWNMSNSSLWPFASAATATSTITNNQTGTVSFDVTADVQAFVNGSTQNYGWLLKKVDEGANGQIEFGTKESANSPQLIITTN